MQILREKILHERNFYTFNSLHERNFYIDNSLHKRNF